MANEISLTTLAQRPSMREEVIQLIEEAFQYRPPFKLAEDFYPLFALRNAPHNYLICQKQELVGHIGLRLVDLCYGGQLIKAAFLGGLAIRADQRGKGIFKQALQEVLSFYENQVGLFILWSDQAELYAKFNFWQAGIVAQLGEKENLISPLLQAGWCKYTPLDGQDKIGRQLPALYQAWAQDYIYVKRTPADWQTLVGIKSATILVHPSGFNGKNSVNFNLSSRATPIDAYCVVGKGFDLGHVVHEVGGDPSFLAEFFKHYQNYKIWLPGAEKWRQAYPFAKQIYTGLFRRGNFALLRPLWAMLPLENQRQIEQLFKAQDDQNFWPQLLGPMDFKLPAIFISGLDSI